MPNDQDGIPNVILLLLTKIAWAGVIIGAAVIAIPFSILAFLGWIFSLE